MSFRPYLVVIKKVLMARKDIVAAFLSLCLCCQRLGIFLALDLRKMLFDMLFEEWPLSFFLIVRKGVWKWDFRIETSKLLGYCRRRPYRTCEKELTTKDVLTKSKKGDYLFEEPFVLSVAPDVIRFWERSKGTAKIQRITYVFDDVLLKEKVEMIERKVLKNCQRLELLNRHPFLCGCLCYQGYLKQCDCKRKFIVFRYHGYFSNNLKKDDAVLLEITGVKNNGKLSCRLRRKIDGVVLIQSLGVP